MLDFLPETNEKLRKFQKDFHAALHGPGQSTPRWRSCLGKINEPLGFALSAKMIEKAFDHEARTQMEVMIQHLKEAFNSMVDEASWIDQDTRIVVKEKAAAMKHLIAYPDWIMDHQLLDEYYDGVSTIYRLIIKLIDFHLLLQLEIQVGSHLENVVHLLEFVSRKERSLLHTETDRTRYVG